MVQRDLRPITRRRTGWGRGVGMGAAPGGGSVAVRGVYEGGWGTTVLSTARGTPMWAAALFRRHSYKLTSEVILQNNEDYATG